MDTRSSILGTLKLDGIYGGLVGAVFRARELSLNSKCSRRQIGCILLGRNGDRLYTMGVGVNGTVLGNCRLDNICPDAAVPAGAGANKHVRCWGIHAEQAAIVNAWNVSGRTPLDVWACVSTKAPCTQCTAMLMATGCQVIIYEDEPNDNDAALFFPGVRMSFKQMRDHFNEVQCRTE